MRSSTHRHLPVVALAAEHLTIGNLMRRNVLAYKAPPNNEGYDLICIHPDPRDAIRSLVRVQVKSRYQIDSDRAPLIRSDTLQACDFVTVVFLNIGHFYTRRLAGGRGTAVEFFTFPSAFVAAHLYQPKSGMAKLRTTSLPDLESYGDERGFDLIAAALGVPYPGALPAT